MAASPLNLAEAGGALKTLFLPPVREQLNTSNWVLAQFEKNTEDFEGEEAVLSLHVGRNKGVGFRAEGATLPEADHQKRTKAHIDMRYSYGRIQVTRPAIKAMKSDRGSFVRAVKPEMKGVMDDLKRDWSRAIMGAGSGVMAETAVTTAANVVNLAADTPRSILRAFEEGARIDIGTVGSPTAVAGNRNVTAVDYDAKTITIDGAVVTTNATTHRIFRQGSGGVGVETVSLQEIISDADDDFEGVDTGLFPTWKANVTDANGATLTDTLLEEVLDELDIVAGLNETPIAATDHRSLRNYAASLKDNKRFVGDPTTLKGGFKAVTIATPGGELAVKRDRDVPDGNVFIFQPQHIVLFELSDWEFVDEDGAVLNRVPDVDAFEAILAKYANLATDRRNAHARITNLG